MPGIATQFTVGDLVLDELRTRGSSLAPDPNDLPYFYLGTLGPSIGDFLPSLPENGSSEPNSRLFAVWLPILLLLTGTSAEPGIYPTLRRLRDILSRFQQAADLGAGGGFAQKDTAKALLLNMIGELDLVDGLVNKLTEQLKTLKDLQERVGDAVLDVEPKDKVPPTRDWRQRDTLHQSLTGRFLAELRRRADATGDRRLIAFATGATVSYGAALCGNPFANGVVGGPHRNHWWRHRYIANYLDVWVFGYYSTRLRLRRDKREVILNEVTLQPVPAYSTWDNACGAELQRRIEFGGISADAVLNAVRDATPMPSFLPPEVVDLWLKSYEVVYSGLGEANGVDAAGLQSSYALMWLTLWIATSAEFLTCTPPGQVNLPDACGKQPDWVASDGGVAVGGKIIKPDTVGQPRANPSVAEVASGIIAALVGVAVSLTGVFILAGVALIGVGVGLIVDGVTDPDWPKLQCHGRWLAVYMTNLENTFREVLVTAGLGLPYTEQLNHNPIIYQYNQSVEPDGAALNTCRSPFSDETVYPRSKWNPGRNKSNWTSYPVEPLEEPAQVSYPHKKAWPYHFVDGMEASDGGVGANPRFTTAQKNAVTIGAGGRLKVLDAETWEQRRNLLRESPAFDSLWGNAVDVSLAILAAKPQEILDWDLDGDRGIGFPTWLGSPNDPKPE